MSTTATYQHYHERVVTGTRAQAAADDFARLAAKQSGEAFPVRGGDEDDYVTIDLEDWPSEQPFGDWFDEWAERWGITIID